MLYEMAETKTDFTRTVLIAIDGSEFSKSALEWYIQNGHKEGDNALIAFCVENVALPPTAMMAGNPSAIQAMIREHEEHTRKVFKDIEEYLHKFKIQHVLEKLHGSPGDAIVKAAEKQNADFIVMGSRGQGTIRRTIMGSVSDYVVHHSRIPVIICKHT